MIKFLTTNVVDKVLDDKIAMKIFKEAAKQSNVNSNYASILNIVNEILFMHYKSTKNVIHCHLKSFVKLRNDLETILANKVCFFM